MGKSGGEMTKAGYVDKITFRSGSQLFTKGILVVSTLPPPPPPIYSWNEIISAYMFPCVVPTTGESYGTYKLDGINNLSMIPVIVPQTPLLDIMQYPIFNQTFATYMEIVGLNLYPVVYQIPSETYTTLSESVSFTS